MKKTILYSGNEAMGEAAIRAGLKFYAGYPITPQNELTAYMADQLSQRGGIFIQSESELAAINMIFGASAAGARVMTSSSSPGISLKQEGISYIAGAQLPAVIINVMRAGPGLGNIWPAQSDYFQATKGGGHGDYHLIVLAPASVQESFDLTRLAFELADRHRIAVMVLSDGLLGQMMEGLTFDEELAPPAAVEKTIGALTGASGRKPHVVCSLFMKRPDVEKKQSYIAEEVPQGRIAGGPLCRDIYGRCCHGGRRLRFCGAHRRGRRAPPARQGQKGRIVPSCHALAVPGKAPGRPQPARQKIPGCRDVLRPDGRRRPLERRGPRSRLFLRPVRRRGPDGIADRARGPQEFVGAFEEKETVGWEKIIQDLRR